jgi:hypothetical protein
VLQAALSALVSVNLFGTPAFEGEFKCERNGNVNEAGKEKLQRTSKLEELRESFRIMNTSQIMLMRRLHSVSTRWMTKEEYGWSRWFSVVEGRPPAILCAGKEVLRVLGFVLRDTVRHTEMVRWFY